MTFRLEAVALESLRHGLLKYDLQQQWDELLTIARQKSFLQRVVWTSLRTDRAQLLALMQSAP